METGRWVTHTSSTAHETAKNVQNRASLLVFFYSHFFYVPFFVIKFLFGKFIFVLFALSFRHHKCVINVHIFFVVVFFLLKRLCHFQPMRKVIYAVNLNIKWWQTIFLHNFSNASEKNYRFRIFNEKKYFRTKYSLKKFEMVEPSSRFVDSFSHLFFIFCVTALNHMIEN